MKRIHLFLLGMVVCCMTATAQSVLPPVPDSIRVKAKDLTSKVGDFINKQTPE